MAASQQQLLDGVFAVKKPGGMTSADICNQIKYKLTESKMFLPYIMEKGAERDDQKRLNRGRLQRALRGKIHVKIGHGGTLDPSASGVITFGVGTGTKALDFLTKGSMKGYEAVLLFGAATDTFDGDGKVVGRKAWEHLSEDKVEAALNKFRGKIMQRPSVYSALKRGGVRMYEYAREGKDIPELEKREMFVHNLELLEWMKGGDHKYHWPRGEIAKGSKDAFVKVLRFDEIGGVDVVDGADIEEEQPLDNKKRKLKNTQDPRRRKQSRNDSNIHVHDHDQKDGSDMEGPETTEPAAVSDEANPYAEEQATRTEEAMLDSRSPDPPCPAPAVRLRMTVSSGFYVRSLCHDLAVELGSLGVMAKLVRTKQACFELGKNVLDYEDFDAGEEVWGPKVAKELDAWQSRFEDIKKDREDS